MSPQLPLSLTKHVALVVETSNAYARGLLVGVRKYLATRPAWSIYIGEHSRQDTDLSWLEGWHGDGVIARIENEQTALQVRKLGVPVVDLSSARLALEFPCVETDDEMMARWAVRHFAERGIDNFAYCGDSRFGWSINRQEHFSHQVRAHGQGRLAHLFELSDSGTAADSRRALVDWLHSLPKPVGIWACYDIAGQELLEACKVANLAVPYSVAVLGVDNDELICNLTSPPMSSIQPDATSTGYLAAQLLDSMMVGAVVDPELYPIPPLRIEPRLSSDVLSVDDPLVVKALRWIREHADESIRVDDVTRQVNLSRRSLDYRFVGALGRTVHDEITRVRMSRVAELLLHTDWPLTRIAERLGFRQSEYMGVAFRRHVGRSPGEFRQLNGGTRSL
ncbi:DNA-binding transcriptional regulator [Herbiconiux moechotypicola]|uniref:DNA-binding transcriptional regulator n=1 Tax=Herbiconiux moechotypicola TaxID=637393 RepID=A0ABN3DPF0_9MICO|nr:DNA-binding transcriptional regulator [Herbiconiux moechotypicola]MCS5731658.1 DNA-binding transcriptional regulator [Herbiconiux moechotypicola]